MFTSYTRISLFMSIWTLMHGINWYSFDSVKVVFSRSPSGRAGLWSNMNPPARWRVLQEDSCYNDKEISQMVLLKFINEFCPVHNFFRPTFYNKFQTMFLNLEQCRRNYSLNDWFWYNSSEFIELALTHVVWSFT